MITALLFAPLALACYDPAYKQIPDAYKALREYESNNSSFARCLDKVEKDGVNLKDVQAWRKERPANDNGPVVYTIKVQGQNRADEPTWLEIKYDLSKHAFTCGEVSHVIYRCFLSE